VNIPRRFWVNPSAEYFGSRSIFTGTSRYSAIPPVFQRPGVPPNLPGSIQTRFDASEVLRAGSNSQEFRKGSLETREFVAGGGIHPTSTGNCRRRGLLSCTGAVILAELEQWSRSI